MDLTEKTVGKVNLGAPLGADLGTSSGYEGWKDVLQLLKKQNEKMEKLSRAQSVIQNNTYRCLLESGVELQSRLETHPASKKWLSFGDCALRPASRVDIAVRVVRGRNLFVSPLGGATSRFA